jgi:hypothetical protein
MKKSRAKILSSEQHIKRIYGVLTRLRSGQIDLDSTSHRNAEEIGHMLNLLRGSLDLHFRVLSKQIKELKEEVAALKPPPHTS